MVATVDYLSRLKKVIRPTTFIQSNVLNTTLGVDLVLASETFQYTGSFKFRAAYNVAQQSKASKLIVASAGNFGQSLAYACQLLGKDCIVVMPDKAAKVKIDAVRGYGAVVDLVDTAKVTREERVRQLAEENPDAAVASAHNDPVVFEGNSTLADELVQISHLFDTVVVPVGGGGLVSGIITGLARNGTKKSILGAEPKLANDAARSLAAGHLIKDEKESDTLADGARLTSLGDHAWPIIQAGIDGIIEVGEAQIKEAVRLLFREANLKAEPTGALSLGAVLSQPQSFKGKKVCCVVSGGNVDPDLYCRILSEAI
jgi:threonine dehydratase